MTISLAFLSPTLVKAALTVGCLGASALPASATRRLNGRNSTRCSGCLPKNGRRSRKRSRIPCRARNGFPDRRDKRSKTAPFEFADWQRPHLTALNPAKARRFKAFAPGSETLGTEWTAWWRRED